MFILLKKTYPCQVVRNPYVNPVAGEAEDGPAEVHGALSGPTDPKLYHRPPRRMMTQLMSRDPGSATSFSLFTKNKGVKSYEHV